MSNFPAQLAWLRPTGPTPTSATESFLRLDDEVRRLELTFDAGALLDFVDRVGLTRVEDHVARYRKIVRLHPWPNVPRPTSHEAFLADYQAAARVYVHAGFLALNHLVRGRLEPKEVDLIVAASEALRGQFGKQSPTGLDARLDETVERLATRLQSLFGSTTDAMLDVLCAPSGDLATAEAGLLEDLLELSPSLRRRMTPREVEGLGDEDRAALMRFLRRHCRWSLKRFHTLCLLLDDDQLAPRVTHACRRRAELDRRRAELIDTIGRDFGAEMQNEVVDLAEQAAQLNTLNLALEPAFSFKGCVGLPHGLIFDRGLARLPGVVEAPATSTLKWRLLDAAGIA